MCDIFYKTTGFQLRNNGFSCDTVNRFSIVLKGLMRFSGQRPKGRKTRVSLCCELNNCRLYRAHAKRRLDKLWLETRANNWRDVSVVTSSAGARTSMTDSIQSTCAYSVYRSAVTPAPARKQHDIATITTGLMSVKRLSVKPVHRRRPSAIKIKGWQKLFIMRMLYCDALYWQFYF